MDNFDLLKRLIKCTLSIETFMVLFFFFYLIFLGFFGGEGVGFRLERGTSFFPLAFSFEVVFVLSIKTGSKPDCYAGLKKVLGSSCAPRDLFS